MKGNIWKVIAIVFFVISLVEFIFGYSIIMNEKTSSTIKIKELEMMVDQLEKDTGNGGALGPDDY